MKYLGAIAIIAGLIVAYSAFSEQAKAPQAVSPGAKEAAKEPGKDVAKDQAGATGAAAQAKGVKPEEKPKSVCRDVGDLAKDLEDKRKEVEERERRVVDLEYKLKMQDGIIREKLDRIEKLKDEIARMLEGYNRNLSMKNEKMVKIVETMTPKNAADMLEKMDENVAIQLLEKMDNTKIAKILNNMEKKKSASLSEKLSGKGALPPFEISGGGKEEQPTN